MALHRNARWNALVFLGAWFTSAHAFGFGSKPPVTPPQPTATAIPTSPPTNVPTATPTVIPTITPTVTPTSVPTAPPAVKNQIIPIRVTCYQDGVSCPGNCDSHAVFEPANNSSRGNLRNGYARGTRSEPQPCRNGQPCTTCFSKDPEDCVDTIYRGTGPGEGRIDVTPNFLHENCYKPGTLELQDRIPAGLVSECKRVGNSAVKFEQKINCIANPRHPACAAYMDAQIERKRKDQVLYDECRRVGQSKFNQGRPASEQRIYDCAYRSQITAHGPDNTRRWHDLLPAACGDNFFVSPNGLDCCSADSVTSACSGDCGVFFK